MIMKYIETNSHDDEVPASVIEIIVIIIIIWIMIIMIMIIMT